jgi:hypothetical protein
VPKELGFGTDVCVVEEAFEGRLVGWTLPVGGAVCVAVGVMLVDISVVGEASDEVISVGETPVGVVPGEPSVALGSAGVEFIGVELSAEDGFVGKLVDDPGPEESIGVCVVEDGLPVEHTYPDVGSNCIGERVLD